MFKDNQVQKLVSSVYHPTTLSLFSGAGGLDIGFHKAGFQIVACVEKEKIFCDTLRANIGKYLDLECQIINKDINELNPIDIQVQHIEFIIGGPPCQSFSAIGRRAGGAEGTRDDRGNLFEQYCRLVDHFKPKGFAFENVRGILSSNKGEDWRRILKTFANLGYQLHYRVLDTADYGVPQHRERLLMIGTKAEKFLFPRPTHGPTSIDQRPFISAQEAIHDLQDSSEPFHVYHGKHGHLLEQVPPGMNYHHFTKELGHPFPIFAWRSRFSDFLYKADPSKPVRTIVAQLGAYSGPFHWKNRKFSLAEFKRLQSFPDDYDFVGSLNNILKQLGNSVPPVFAEKIALAIAQQLFAVDAGINLLNDDEKFSFDERKAQKARRTRANRERLQPSQGSLFDSHEDCNESQVEQSAKVRLLNYSSPTKRIVIYDLSSNVNGRIYQEEVKRCGQKVTIYISQYVQEKMLDNPTIQYSLNFHYAIGNGVKQVECVLCSNDNDDIYVIWDSIEQYLSENSSYQTMFDVYGHFTEPHPIFELKVDILTEKPSPVILFAKEFADFGVTSKTLPQHTLRNFFTNLIEDGYSLTQIVQHLRSLRFDLRAYETNRSIPIGYFKCCYPFTISLNRQISIVWRERIEYHDI